MPIEKPTQAGVDHLIDRLSVLRDRLRRVEKIHKYKRTDHWDSLKDLLVDMREMHQRDLTTTIEYRPDLDDHERMNLVRRHQDSREIFAWIVDLVEKPDNEANKLRDTITALEKSLAEKRSEIAAFGLAENKS